MAHSKGANLETFNEGPLTKQQMELGVHGYGVG